MSKKTAKEALQQMYDDGVRQIDVYFAEDIQDGDTLWSVDVMCDPVNDICNTNWTWVVESINLFKECVEEEGYFVADDYEIITCNPFSERVVCGAINHWLVCNDLSINVQMIDVDDAVGSGYIRSLRDIDYESLIEDAIPWEDTKQ